MVYRLESPLLSLGLPDVLAQVMAEVLTHEEMREILEDEMFKMMLTRIGRFYDESEATAVQQERSLDAVEIPKIAEMMKESIDKLRKNTLKLCNKMMLDSIKNAQTRVISMRESRTRMTEIEREFEEKIMEILEEDFG